MSVHERVGPVAASMPHSAIQLRRVVKTYESEAGSFTALQDVDLQITPGEFVGVIGKSGSGKSTLLNMITAIV